MPILELIDKIIQRPGIYVGPDVTLEKIHLFISGYYVRGCELGLNDTSFDDFSEFVARKYNEKRTVAWFHIIRYNTASDKDAFETFVRLFQMYKESNSSI